MIASHSHSNIDLKHSIESRISIQNQMKISPKNI